MKPENMIINIIKFWKRPTNINVENEFIKFGKSSTLMQVLPTDYLAQ